MRDRRWRATPGGFMRGGIMPNVDLFGSARRALPICSGLFCALALLASAGMVHAQASTGDAANSKPDADEQLAEVVVTGFRVSLDVALETKREATGAVDAIVAEDIADFPDSNLAESIQ